MGTTALLLVILGTFLLFSLVVLWLLRRVVEPGPLGDGGSPTRPWWGNPLVWLAVSAVFVLVGVFLAPRFLPGVVVFIPFLWLAKPRVRRYGRHEDAA